MVNAKEIESFYKEYCEEQGRRFTKKEFLSFVEFCEADFYDWLKGNLKYFNPDTGKAY